VDFDDAPEEAAFRAEARAWLEAHASRRAKADRRPAAAFSAGGEDLAAMVTSAKRWQAALCDGGWAGITWPSEYGGRGGTAIQQVIFNEELAAFDVPASGIFTIGLGMVGPTLIRHGTEDQRRRYLPPLLHGDEVWCQLFSEPGAGSDLASLVTRAVSDGDGGWIVNGQKVWTSGAHYREFGLLLARTGTGRSRHDGLTCFLVDMHTPGIDVRPLRQMTGGASFNEVFLTDVALPAESVLGPVGGGWKVAITTLANERVALGGSGGGIVADDLVALARAEGRCGDAVVRQQLADVYARQQVVRFLGLRMRTNLSRGAVPGPEGSVAKLAASDLAQRVGDVALALLGPAGTLLGGAPERDMWALHRLGAPALRIAGGTDEVMRNIVGERVLGLPKEPNPIS
jgi:alkylation response protein AidB-like acyl-CoA dehydrogenase